ncbi:MAG: hypothetical protein Q4P29_03585 [Tissierellia bacterium]|nr:hypothetical protein [Tissierellia bacterium]
MRDYNRKLVEIVASQALKKMKKDPKRELRRLVDFGKTMAKGNNQNEFFDLAQDIIESENSKYYTMLDSIFGKFDNKKLKEFSLNFGYNGLIRGAKKIQDNMDFNISWMHEFSEKDLSKDDLNSEINNLKDRGIYIYTIFPNDKNHLDKVEEIARKNQDCAFIMFLNDIDIPNNIIKLDNLIMLIDSKSMKQLDNLDMKNFVGIWHSFSDSNYKEILDGKLARVCENNNLPFLIFVNDKASKDVEREIAEYAYRERFKPKYAAFTIEYENDIRRINKMILNKNVKPKLQNADAKN